MSNNKAKKRKIEFLNKLLSKSYQIKIMDNMRHNCI